MGFLVTVHSDVWKHIILWLWPLQEWDWGLVEPQICSDLVDCRLKEMLAPSPGIVLSGGSLQFRRIHLPYLSDVSVIGFDNLLSCASDFCRELWYFGFGWYCLPLREQNPAIEWTKISMLVKLKGDIVYIEECYTTISTQIKLWTEICKVFSEDSFKTLNVLKSFLAFHPQFCSLQ